MKFDLTGMLNSLYRFLYHFVSCMNQIQADIPAVSLNVIEDKTLVTSASALVDAETKRTNEQKSYLQQAVANLESKLCTAEEDKLKMKKV